MNDLIIFDDFESFLVTVGSLESKESKFHFTVSCNKILFTEDFVEFSYCDKIISSVFLPDVLSIRKILYSGSEDFVLIYSKE